MSDVAAWTCAGCGWPASDCNCIRAAAPIPTCVVCGKPRYQKHAERCAGRPPYAIARDIVDGGDYERVEVLRLARAYLAMSGIRP